MTRAKAIEQLQNCKDLIKQNGQDYLDERDFPLLDMAIDALQGDMYCPNCGVRLVPEDEYLEPKFYDEDDYWNERVPTHNRLINASWVINEIHKNICDMCEQGIDIEDCNDCKIDKIKRIIYSAPTPSIEVEQGEWICKGDYAICSKCGGSSGTQFNGVEPIPRITAYCPHCGRRMKGAEHEID